MRPILLLLLLSACEPLDEFNLTNPPGADGGTVPDGGLVPTLAVVPTDVVMIIDNSGSMADEQLNLAINFEAFVDQIIGVGDYRLGVVTTDITSIHPADGMRESLYDSGPYHYFVGFSPQSFCEESTRQRGCFHNDTRWATFVNSSTMDRQAQLAAFAANIQVGTCGSGEEQGLGAMILAVEKMVGSDCNRDFLRPEANLLIIFVTDEDDSSPGPVEDYVARLSQFKDPAQIRIAVIGGLLGGQPTRCNTTQGAQCGTLCAMPPPPDSLTSCATSSQCAADEICSHRKCVHGATAYWEYCDWCSYYDAPGCCSAMPSSRYVAFARAMEAEIHQAAPQFPQNGCVQLGSKVSCLVDTICQDNFGDTLARIARELVIAR